MGGKEQRKAKIMAAKANKSDLNNETPVKRGRGRPKGSVTNKQKQGAYNIFKRSFAYALDEMEKDPAKPLHKLIKDALTKDIRDISKFAFLFPQQKQTDIDVKLVKTINVVADRIKDYKREERLNKAKTIDITPTKIEE
jgi:hypothetical protein